MGVRHEPPHPASDRACAFAARNPAVDLHADTLLWGRNLNQGGSRGHIDVPLLIESNVAVQAFTIVTRVPLGLNFTRNRADAPDLIPLLTKAELWPPRACRSLTQRALYQAESSAAPRTPPTASSPSSAPGPSSTDTSNAVRRSRASPPASWASKAHRSSMATWLTWVSRMMPASA